MAVELSNISKRFGSIVAVDDISLTITDGEFLILVGPSGCGKTTTLRMIAGLETPSSGQIYFDGEDVTQYSPQQRHIAFVFQNYALYPHMTTRKNMSFALEDQGIPSDEVDQRVTSTAEKLGISSQLDQRPGELSGGQQQRVALGRSIVRNPSVFLLDEPLSNLDAKLRTNMRAELQELHQDLETTMVYVTHDQEEAMTMGDRIAIMNEGTIQQVAPPNEAYNQPANRFVAGFIGSPSMNFFDASLEDGRVRAGPFTIPAPDGVSGPLSELGIRPEDVSVKPTATGEDVSATVTVFEQVGSSNIIYLGIDGETMIAETDASVQLAPGDEVGVSLDTDRVHLFDQEGGSVHSPSLYQRTIEQSA
ncbi:ABC transporter ATP-binding protein [Halococcus sp. IIIV-5B]|uniref:ABC transporter ATP-binding protein n=1 Tax=Halococcus sp. IIIV-5B TaxID=2321230 RepID=UPI000E71A613|nr:ABC transporter ATP-binding protein [Halococcus sp. IIIV-5B]RJT05450.1 ABC transporter ATP-binding protein [Halococcus sp. IIIV-5B]